ncbi:MAG: hypothetical protein ABMB14_29600 [Myxococcota bacterium]
MDDPTYYDLVSLVVADDDGYTGVRAITTDVWRKAQPECMKNDFVNPVMDPDRGLCPPRPGARRRHPITFRHKVRLRRDRARVIGRVGGMG